MHEAAVRPDSLSEPGEKSDHVVAGFSLDGFDPLEIRRSDRSNPRLPARADGLRRFLGNSAEHGHRLRGQRFDFKPDPEPILGGPDGGHLWSTVAGDHSRKRPRQPIARASLVLARLTMPRSTIQKIAWSLAPSSLLLPPFFRSSSLTLRWRAITPWRSEERRVGTEGR